MRFRPGTDVECALWQGRDRCDAGLEKVHQALFLSLLGDGPLVGRFEQGDVSSEGVQLLVAGGIVTEPRTDGLYDADGRGPLGHDATIVATGVTGETALPRGVQSGATPFGISVPSLSTATLGAG